MEKILEIIPAKYHALVLFLLAVSPYITRAFHSLVNGGGLRSIMGAIWFGTNTPAKKDDAQGRLLNIFIIAFAVAGLSGCAHVSVHDPATGNRVVSAWLPAWPWQDVSQSVSRLTVASSTNKFSTSLSGLGTETATSTNAVDMLNGVVGAAVGAAVHAAKP